MSPWNAITMFSQQMYKHSKTPLLQIALLAPRNPGSLTLYRAWLTCEHHLFSQTKNKKHCQMLLFQLALFATQKPRLFDSATHVHLKCVDRKRLFEAPEHTTSSSMRRVCLAVHPEISTACDAQDLLCLDCSTSICLNFIQFHRFNLEHRAMQPYLISLTQITSENWILRI